MNGDGVDDLIVGIHRGDNGGYSAGEAYVIYGQEGSSRGTISLDLPINPADGFIIEGDTVEGRAGRSLSSAGDVNGDGIDDLIIGAPYGYGAGEAYVIFGKEGRTRGTVDAAALASRPSDGFVIAGDQVADRASFSVASAGDMNGDGIDDLIVGAPFGDSGGLQAGETYVIYGKTGNRGLFDVTGLSSRPTDGFIIMGDAMMDQAGFSVSRAGDVNDDGIDDIIIGVPFGDDGGSDAGEANVIYGKAGRARGTLDLNGLDGIDGFIIQGDSGGDRAGYSVSSAGDVDGDGIADLIVGAPFGDDGGSNAGEAYVVYGKAGERSTFNLSGLPDRPSDGFTIQGDTAGDQAGFSVSSAGDVNGDGIDDLILGAPLGDDGGSNAGESYVIFGQTGRTRGAIDLTGLDASDGFVIQGEGALHFAGFSVSSAGDVNGDGIDDLILGAPNGSNGASRAGQAYVIYGQRPTTAVERIGTAIGQAIFGGALSDTLSGLGGRDTLFGGNGNDTLFGGRGNDTLWGGIGKDTMFGGPGSDQMAGGLGNDTYFITAGDTIIERANKGTDTVRSSVSFSLGANVENLALTGTAGLAGTGNSANNAITGNAGGNRLSAGSGNDRLDGNAGNDRLFGGDGNDVLSGGTGKDMLLGGDGNDRLYGGSNDDRLFGDDRTDRLSGGDGNDTIYGGSGDDDLNGNAGHDQLSGGAGADVINGGTGRDTLTGGGGFDTFVFSSTPRASQADVIRDFNVAQDTIRLDMDVFTVLSAGRLAATAFVSNASGTATNTNHRIIHDNTSGELFYDPDGTGRAPAIRFADLNGGLDLTSADFFVF